MIGLGFDLSSNLYHSEYLPGSLDSSEGNVASLRSPEAKANKLSRLVAYLSRLWDATDSPQRIKLEFNLPWKLLIGLNFDLNCNLPHASFISSR